ncbi:hypothetical protein T02_2341, partial [Trichinella nativa]
LDHCSYFHFYNCYYYYCFYCFYMRSTFEKKILSWSFCYFLHTNEMKTQKNVPAPAQSTFYTFERFLQIQLSSSLLEERCGSSRLGLLRL